MDNEKQEILKALRQYWREHKMAPSIEELAELTETPRMSVQRAIHKMAADGLVTMTPGKHRTIRPVKR